ncbi:MAG TPA: NAD-dependent epimerase/dehydratase family protein [Polyangiaceae bacterium]|nr:NAD-dependent epimerase/dehydratase family protein [Polyangiaceae bacterium]
MRVLVIGGTGSFSTRVTQKALERGHDVLVYARGRRPLLDGLPARRLHADRAELRAQAAEVARFGPDVVVDSICFDPTRAEDLVALFGAARRVVLISSVDVYGEDVGCAPVTEKRAPAPVSPYGKAKLASEQVVLAGLGERATVFRPSHILGRTFLTTSLWGRSPHLVSRIQQGKPVPAIDGGCNLMTPVYAGDVAEWVVRSFDSPAADGQVFNAVGGEIITQRRYYECIARALGTPLALVAVPSAIFRRHFDAPSQFNWHRPYSCEKAVAALGHAPLGTPELMLEETVRYMLDAGLVRDAAEQPFDDALVELLVRHEAELGELLARKAATPR